MTDFIEIPNLPQYKVTEVLLGDKYSDTLSRAFNNMGINTILLPDNSSVDSRLCGHADLSVCHIRKSKFVVNKVIQCAFSEISDYNILYTEMISGAEFPNDIGLNAAIVGNIVFHRLDYMDKVLKINLIHNGYFFKNVKQGYTKCSVCVIDENHIITQDSGIAKQADLCGIESLCISNKGIELTGYDTGFIGGSCGKLDKDVIAFTGTLKHHPDYDNIMRFVQKCGCEIIFLTDEPCFDIGSIVPTKELKA